VPAGVPDLRRRRPGADRRPRARGPGVRPPGAVVSLMASPRRWILCALSLDRAAGADRRGDPAGPVLGASGWVVRAPWQV